MKLAALLVFFAILSSGAQTASTHTWRYIRVGAPDNIADTGAGLSLWASGSQLCIGAKPTLVPYPTSTSRKAMSTTMKVPLGMRKLLVAKDMMVILGCATGRSGPIG